MDNQEQKYTVTFTDDDLNGLMQLIDAGCRHLGANATGAAYRWQTLLFNAKNTDNGKGTKLPTLDKQPTGGKEQNSEN